MKKLLTIFVIVFMIGIGVTSTRAQFLNDNLYLGPTIGYTYYFTGGALGLGGRAEYGLIDNLAIGSWNGALGLGAEVSYSSSSENWYYGSATYTLIGFLVYASYHIQPQKAFDPYARAGLGFNNVNVTYKSNDGSNWSWGSGSYGSGLGYEASIGFYYHFSKGMAFRADLGWPFLLSAGLDFNLGSMGWQSKKEK